MRWRSLFDDLEAQLAAERQAESHSVGVERARLRDAGVTLTDRLADLARRQGRIRVRLIDGSRFEVAELQVGEGWFAGVEWEGVVEASARLVPFHAIAAVNALDSAGSPAQSAGGDDRDRGSPPSAVSSLRLPLDVALRDLARRRVPIEVLVPGERLHGTIDRVGADHFELARHRSGTPRRAGEVDTIDLVPFAQLLWLRFRW